MTLPEVLAESTPALEGPPVHFGTDQRRLNALVREHLPPMYRLLRHLGVREGDVDDALQQVFLVLARRLDEVKPGRERAFLSTTALRIASRSRRTNQRRKEELGHEGLDMAADPAPTPEHHLEQTEAERLLCEVLERLPDAQREVFVLFELHELGLREIAGLLALPQGTIASRLRLARARFMSEVTERSMQDPGRRTP